MVPNRRNDCTAWFKKLYFEMQKNIVNSVDLKASAVGFKDEKVQYRNGGQSFVESNWNFLARCPVGGQMKL